MPINATIISSIKEECNSPCILSFLVQHGLVQEMAVLIGDYARVLQHTLRHGDQIIINNFERINGTFINHHTVMSIESMILPESAKVGRNVNITV